MPVVNGIIVPPIDFQNTVAAALGVSLTDCGLLCNNAHGRINKWAKQKPVIVANALAQLAAADFRSASYGISIPVYANIGSVSTPGTLLYALRNGLTSWAYAPPFGGMAAPFRITDFNGYYHQAKRPFEPPNPGTYFIDREGNLQVDLDMSQGDERSLSAFDLSVNGIAMANMYVGGLFYYADGRTLVATAGSPAGSSLSIRLTGMTATYAGSCTVYPFLSSVPIPVFSTAPAGSFSPIEVEPVAITIRDARTAVTVTALGYWSAAGTVTYTVYIQNDMPTAQTLTGVRVSLYRTAGAQTPQNGELVANGINIGNVNIGGSATLTYGPYSLNASRQAGYTYWLGGFATGYDTTYYPPEEAPPG